MYTHTCMHWMYQDGRLSQAESYRDRSVLGLTLFLVIIMTSMTGSRPPAKMFWWHQDAAQEKKVGTQADCDKLHKDLHTMYKWSDVWRMVFSILVYLIKCKCLHIRHGNSQTSDHLWGTDVQRTSPTATHERGSSPLLVHFHRKYDSQCAVC